MSDYTRKAPPAGPHPDGSWCSACDRDPEYHFYIPTTEEIRTEFCYDERNPVNNYGELFDRWLAQYEAEVIKVTKERIIALLETECVCEPMRGDKGDCGFCDIVALIKGENE